MRDYLTETQKFYLEQQHRVEPNSDVSDRIKAILLSDKGWTYRHIAEALLIHEATVATHVEEYITSRKLNNESGGSVSKLNGAQTEELIRHLEQNTYPSTKEIIVYVAEKYGISYTQQGMHDWLKHHDFSYKKPKGVPLKCNEELQEAFIQKYADLKAGLKPTEVILFMDSVHPTSATKITYGWIRTGVGKLIATTAGHGRINLTGALNLDTMKLVTRDYATINGSSTVDFLGLILETYSNATKIHVILDGGKAHTAHEVKLFLSESAAVNRFYLADTYNLQLPANNIKLSKKILAQLEVVLAKEPSLFKDENILKQDNLTAKVLLSGLRDVSPHPKLVLHPLPAYSPNLNPIERVWQLTNEKVRNNVVFKTCIDFKDKVLKFYSSIWDTISSELRNRINDNFQKLKPSG
jgi:transposase